MHNFLQSVLGKYYLVFLGMPNIVSSWFVSDVVISILNHSFLLSILVLHLCPILFTLGKNKT